MGLFGNYLVRKIYKGPYIPGLSSGNLGSYARAQRGFYNSVTGGSNRRYGGSRGGDGLTSDILDSASAIFNSGAEKRMFESFCNDIIEGLNDIADLNPGQKAIVEQLQDGAKRSAKRRGKNFKSDSFLSDVRIDIGDEKYNAISQSLENAAKLIEEASHAAFTGAEWWDYASIALNSFSGTAFIRSRFGSAAARFVNRVQEYRALERRREMLRYSRSLRRMAFSNIYTPGRIYASDAAALRAYQTRAASNFRKQFPGMAARGIAWDSTEASTARSRATAQKFFEDRGYRRQSNGSYLSRNDVKQIQDTKMKTNLWGYRW